MRHRIEDSTNIYWWVEIDNEDDDPDYITISDNADDGIYVPVWKIPELIKVLQEFQRV